MYYIVKKKNGIGLTSLCKQYIVNYGGAHMNKFKQAKNYNTSVLKEKVKEVWGIRNMPSVEFKLPEISYTPIGMSKVDIFELRKEYSRIRSIVKKRAKRMIDAGKQSYLTRYAKDLITLTDIGLDVERLKENLLLAVELYKQPTLYDFRFYENEVRKIKEDIGLGDDIPDDVVGKFWKMVRAIMPLTMIDSPRMHRRINDIVNNNDNYKDMIDLFSDYLAVESGGGVS